MASYDVKRVDLSVVVTHQAELAPMNRPVDSIAVLSVTGGGAPRVHLGAGPAIPVYQGFAVDICPVELDGIFYANPTAVVGEMVVLVSYGGVSVVAQ